MIGSIFKLFRRSRPEPFSPYPALARYIAENEQRIAERAEQMKRSLAGADLVKENHMAFDASTMAGLQHLVRSIKESEDLMIDSERKPNARHRQAHREQKARDLLWKYRDQIIAMINQATASERSVPVTLDEQSGRDLVTIHRQPTESMIKAGRSALGFCDGSLEQAFHRMVAESVRLLRLPDTSHARREPRCHACGLGYRCYDPDCRNTKEAPSPLNGPIG